MYKLQKDMDMNKINEAQRMNFQYNTLRCLSNLICAKLITEYI
mgnify:CR=1 FL=1